MKHKDNIENLINMTELFVRSFWIAVKRNLLASGYIEPLSFFLGESRSADKKKEFEILGNEALQEVLSRLNNSKKELINSLQLIGSISDIEKTYEKITPTVGKQIINWLFRINNIPVQLTILEIISSQPPHYAPNIKLKLSSFLVNDGTEIKLIRNLSEYFQLAAELEPKGRMFYRGQGNINYIVQPSIMRNARHINSESRLYQELTIRCPNAFIDCRSHIDYLVKMQHYALPTRLIDITSNPLVAIYFAASKSESGSSGEVILFDIASQNIKYERSDTVTILSCLPLFSKQEQDTLLERAEILSKENFNADNDVKRLIQEIRSEKPAFEGKIEPSDLCRSIVVTPQMKNERIAKQSGAFIICGLTRKSDDTKSIEDLRYTSSYQKKMLICIPDSDKEHIRIELQSIAVSRATLFPEIDDVAEYLKNEWLSGDE